MFPLSRTRQNDVPVSPLCSSAGTFSHSIAVNVTFLIFIVSLYNTKHGADKKDFYEIQSLQWRKSLFVFSALILFYFVAVGLISLAVVLSLGFFVAGQGFWTSSFIYKLLGFDLLASALIAWFHFQDARRFGAAYILKRLEARPPDPSDRYHKQFLNTLDEIRIAAGVPKVNAYVIPAFAVNSMALVQADRTPAVAITEGLLAECTRDELQAVAAHELAHIARGDAFYVTLVCSLANFFEKLKEALEPEQSEPQPGLLGRGPAEGAAARCSSMSPPPFHPLSCALLSTLISRERELLADAAAVEFGRVPPPWPGPSIKPMSKTRSSVIFPLLMARSSSWPLNPRTSRTVSSAGSSTPTPRS